jgi:hypothetical protein
VATSSAPVSVAPLDPSATQLPSSSRTSFFPRHSSASPGDPRYEKTSAIRLIETELEGAMAVRQGQFLMPAQILPESESHGRSGLTKGNGISSSSSPSPPLKRQRYVAPDSVGGPSPSTSRGHPRHSYSQDTS